MKLKQYDYLERRYRHLEQLIKEANYEDFNIDIVNNGGRSRI